MLNRSHALQPKHIILKPSEAEKILEEYNISLLQLPKIKITDPGLPSEAVVGDIVKIERKEEESEKTTVYYRAVIV